MTTLYDAPPQVYELIKELRQDGAGYKRIWRSLKEKGYPYGRDHVQEYIASNADVMSAIGKIDDEAQEVSEDWFAKRKIELPPGFIAGTIEEAGPNGEKHWLRVKPVGSERVEIRQAQPVVINKVVSPKFNQISQWQTWLATPDAQIGYWIDLDGNFHSTHDERCFDLSFQVGSALDLYGWLDVGDFGDLQAPSRHNPTTIDTSVPALNRTLQRGCEEFARRRSLVTDEVVVLYGNHDIRLRTKASQEMPFLVGLRRPGEDDYPVLSLPYLMRAKDYGVEWVPSFPTGYRMLNTNLVASHCLAYGSKALDSARKISAKIHASVIFGHTHRRESLAENIETTKGNRTMEVWSDGTFARIDGSLPSERNTFNDSGDRLMAGQLPNPKWGMLSENMHQGFSILHVETGGAERFSVERVAIWDGFCQVRGQSFYATCDSDGNPLSSPPVAD